MARERACQRAAGRRRPAQRSASSTKTRVAGLSSATSRIARATWRGARGVAFDYRIDDEEDDGLHRLECTLAETEPGRLRASALREDGRELSEAELVLVNSELLLAEIRRADPGPPRTDPFWSGWLARLRPSR